MLRLPHEILLNILEDLQFKDVLACRETCRRLNTLFFTSISLQYRVELGACGMIDGVRVPPHNLGVDKRLERLKLHQEAWRTLNWTEYSGINHLAGRLHPLAVAGTALAFPSASDPTSPYICQVLVSQLPSILRGIEDEQRVLTRRINQGLVRFDLLQDLYIYMDMPLRDRMGYLSSISTDEPNPSAHNTGLVKLPRGAEVLDLCGDYTLESHFPEPYGEFALVRNWKTGAIEFETTLASPVPGPIRYLWTYDGCFLDEHHILFYIAVENDESPLLSLPCLVVVPFGRGSDEAPFYMFQLPDFMRGLVSCGLVLPGRATGLHPGHFRVDPDERIISLLPTMQRADGASHHFVIDIPMQALIVRARACVAAPGQHLDVPWDAWGPAITRITRRAAPERDPGMSVSGMRRISVADEAPYAVTVVDYHPRRVARAGAAAVRGACVDVPERAYACDAGVLRTHLPCVVAELPLPEGPARSMRQGRTVGVWLCEDGVLFAEIIPYVRTITNIWAYTI
ncbi:hypothetical protein BV25DRAFT_1663427 [Artomyces pyxidatus]|uniref:Uncharacterized protein n=1 Tax=Artomyces pyxidatus TaxID=48021 RepID=A0ACB8SIF2_9AGAM|nr:hypothetical protein BV25DRAFT_1663427 [Artomyces pyxidatus]